MLWPKPTAEAGRATHMAPRGRQLGRVQKRRAASCAATAAQGAARRLLLSAGGGPPVAGGAARVGAGAGTSARPPCSFSALRSARPRYDPRPPSCRQGQPSDALSDSGDGGADWRGWTSSSAADPGQDRGSDGQQTGRRAGDPAASSRRPPAARSVPSAGQVNSVPARGQAPSSARRSSPDAAQSGRRRRHPVSLGWQSCRVSERASSRT